jgi:hypothetical protein
MICSETVEDEEHLEYFHFLSSFASVKKSVAQKAMESLTLTFPSYPRDATVVSAAMNDSLSA